MLIWLGISLGAFCSVLSSERSLTGPGHVLSLLALSLPKWDTNGLVLCTTCTEIGLSPRPAALRAFTKLIRPLACLLSSVFSVRSKCLSRYNNHREKECSVVLPKLIQELDVNEMIILSNTLLGSSLRPAVCSVYKLLIMNKYIFI